MGAKYGGRERGAQRGEGGGGEFPQHHWPYIAYTNLTSSHKQQYPYADSTHMIAQRVLAEGVGGKEKNGGTS